MFTQELSEASPATAEVRANRQAVRPEPVRDLADRKIGVVEEDDGRPLPGSPGLLMAMGPGFCAELVLMEW